MSASEMQKEQAASNSWMPADLTSGNLVLYGSALAVGAATVTYGMSWLNKRAHAIKPLVDLNNQTTASPTGAKDARVNVQSQDGLKSYAFEDAKTCYEAFRRGARISNNGDCLGYRQKQADGSRPYVWIKYDTVLHRSACIAAGLLKLGCPKGQNTYIGLYAKNCPEWVIMEQACFYFDMVTVPLYDTLGPEAVSFILTHTDIQLCLCDDNAKALKLLTTPEPAPTLKHIIILVDPSDEVKAAADKRNVKLMTLDALEKLADPNVKPTPPLPSSVMTICYTSGTTGMPKGAVITHGNLVAVTTATKGSGQPINPGWHWAVNANLYSKDVFLNRAKVTVDDTFLSFLPLAHMFERLIHVMASVSGGIKKHLFNWALSSKTHELQQDLVVRHDSLWDKLVFSKIRAKMGGKIRLIFTGAAPLSEAVLTFTRCALGCVVLEGYGQTECAAACTLTLEGDHVAGTVGVPLPSVEIKLADVPDMDYYAKDNVGEICVRGPSVFKGYHKDPEKTAEALDKDGWLHTGDVGRWTERGTLKIIDRKKHILKLAQGEYVSPEKIENVYLQSRLVAQMLVHGESLKSSLIGVVVPEQEVLEKEVNKNSNITGTFEELCSNPDVKKMIAADMAKVAKAGGLHSFEQVKEFVVSSEVWTVDNEMLTPTLKTKRPEIRKKFASQLDKIYEKIQ